MTFPVPIPQMFETRRLVVRRCLESDYDGFFSFLNDARSTRFLNLTPDQKTSAGAQAALWYIIHAYDSHDPLFILTVADRLTGLYVGSCGLHPLRDGSGMEFFYNINRERWGEGLATELVQGLMTYVFQKSPVKQLAAFIHPDNRASLRVAEKAGLSNQGTVVHEAYETPVVMVTITSQTFSRLYGRPE